MAKAPKDNSDWTSLPVLTDVVGDVPPGIPTLTEEALNKRKFAQGAVRQNEVLEMSAEEIAALLAPQLEKQLREKLRAQFEVLWQETWMQTRASLPELIHAQLSAQPRSKSSAGNKAAAVDIIAPRGVTSGIKKPAAGKTASAKNNAKNSKTK